MKIRIGHGYDVHRLVSGRRLILGGVDIPFELGLDGHSDADVLLHAVCDAMLGAAGLGDIGRHFPPSDEKFRDMDSRHFLKTVVSMLEQKGWNISNVDITLIAEKPRMSPHIPAIIEILGGDLGVSADQVNIKATTTEGLGFCGTGEGIACHAVVLISQ